ncbi:MAG: futalosine hydrolase [Planctomycetes bacterium]|nr:futalosine hydrolase [Planctomycetota bacterium]
MADAALGGPATGAFELVCAAEVERRGLEDLEVTVLGVGKAAAALGLALAMQARAVRPAGILLFGVAGAFRASGLEPGALCVVGEDRFGDEGVATEDGFADLAELGLGDVGPFVLPPALAAQAAQRLAVPVVSGVTVSTCSGSEGAAAAIAGRTAAAVETMEGAAVALACQRLGLPLLHVRAISNWTGDRARGGWDLPTAVERVQAAVRALHAR